MNEGQTSDSVAASLDAIDQKLLELMDERADLIRQSAAGVAGHQDAIRSAILTSQNRTQLRTQEVCATFTQ